MCLEWYINISFIQWLQLFNWSVTLLPVNNVVRNFAWTVIQETVIAYLLMDDG